MLKINGKPSKSKTVQNSATKSYFLHSLCRVSIEQEINDLLIHSGYFYFVSQAHYYSEALPTQPGYCVGVKDLPKVPTWWIEWDSNPQLFRRIYQ